MSTLMEDRLAAALRARADQVQPEDLRRLDVPVVPLRGERRRRRTAVLAGLAAAAVAAVAGPLVLGGQDGSGSPQPAGPTEPRPTSSTQRAESVLSADVDGDGAADSAWIRDTGGVVEVVVRRASGGRFRALVDEDATGDLLSAGDLGGEPGAELVVPVSDDPSELPLVLTRLGADGLVEAAYPDSDLEGWRPDAPQNRWSADEGGLRIWETGSVPGDERVPFWDWRVSGQGRLLPGLLQLGCLRAAGSEPVACEGPDRWGKDEPDMGAHGDLPTLIPAVDERLSTERFPYGADFFGPESDDYARLRGDFTPEGEVKDGHVELVVLAEGVEHRAPVAAGWNPVLVPRVMAVHGEAPSFVVERPLGDTVFTSVFSFWDGELVELETEGDVFLGSGVVKHDGEMTEQRTWITAHGQVLTALLLDHGARRHQLWRWDLGGTTMTPTDLGEACIDWETGRYGRC